MAACLVQLAVTDHVLMADLAPLVALYYLVVHGPSRLKPIGLGVALVGGAVMSARASFPGVLDGFVLGTAVVTAEVLVAALLADRRVSRRARLAALEVERDQQAEIGAAQERARIARELHDVVAHSLAVMVAQADGGRYAAPEDPDAASRALAQIAETGRDALAQMRRLLGVLRAGEEGGDLPGLVRRLAGAGLPVELEVEGPARALPAELQQCIHRVAQEALTNVLKHADSPRRVEVVLRYLDAEVELTVRDDGRGVAAGRRPGARPGRDARARRAAGRDGARRTAGRRRVRGPRPAAGAGGRRRGAAGVTRVFLVDDQALVRAGLRMVIDSQPDMTVVGEAEDGREALERLAVTTADVVLMDVRMPRLDGVAATRALIERDGDAGPRVIVLTTFDLDEYVFPALRAGASGFLLKNAHPEELLAAIRAVASGDAIVAPTATRRLLEHVASTLPDAPVDDSRLATLSDRERAILLEVARGRSERGDRRRPAHRRGHGQDLPRPAAREARRARPGAAGDLRVRQRAGGAAALSGAVWSRGTYSGSRPQADDRALGRP